MKTVKGVERFYIERIQPLLRERLFNERVAGLPGAKGFLHLAGSLFRLAEVPFLGERFAWTNPEENSLSWLPINKDIEGAGELALPMEALDRIIEKASHRVIVDVCLCRKAMGCKDYPIDIGCLLMGESALKVPKKTGREVGVEEAKAHARRAVEAGLVPITGKARIDNSLFMIPDEGKLLTACFCCECCCITRYLRHVPADKLDVVNPPVAGLSIEVTEECIGCGECVGRCFIDAVEVKGGRAVIGERCRICGRCAAHCPQSAIKLRLDNPHAVEDVVRMVETRVNFGK